MTDLESPAADNSEVDSVIRYVESELTADWQWKASLETRAAGLITANLSAAILYFALQLRFGVTPGLLSASNNTFLLLSSISMALSVFFTIVCFVPLRYHVADRDALEYLVEKAKNGSVALEVVRGRIHQLAQTRRTNRLKASALLAGILFFGLGAIFLILSILTASILP
jgi:hypothetical protein